MVITLVKLAIVCWLWVTPRDQISDRYSTIIEQEHFFTRVLPRVAEYHVQHTYGLVVEKQKGQGGLRASMNERAKDASPRCQATGAIFEKWR